MKNFLFAIAIAAAVAAFPARGADVGVSLNIGEPGFYGQLDMGNVERPPVIYARPVIIERAPRGVALEPLYLRVPPAHARHWRSYCSRYNACGRPVYFVKDDWYNRVYAPRYREVHREERHEERREDRRDDRYDDHHDHDEDHHHDHDRHDDDHYHHD